MTRVPPTEDRVLYVGCYTVGTGGEGTGIGRLAHNPATGRWTSLSSERQAIAVSAGAPRDVPESPSYLAWHPDGRHLYAVSEVADGRIWAFEVDETGAAPRVIGSASTVGEFPCHLSVDPTGHYVVGANYGSGSVSVHQLLVDGSLGQLTDLVQHKGSGPHSERQDGPHAHMASFVRENLLLAVDLGADGVAAYRLDLGTGRLSLAPAPWSALPAGFGPRHLVVLPGELVALGGELTSEIALLRLDPETGGLTMLDIKPASSGAMPSLPSGIDFHGRFVVIANRGPDTISSFEVEQFPGGAQLRHVDEIACGGKHPRSITRIDDLLYVANQYGGNVAVIRIDAETGALTDTGSRIATPTPAHILAPSTRSESASRQEQCD